jgi:hypothetical protein
MLGDSVAVYLDAGFSETGISSTIVDATGLVGGDGIVRVLRDGAISRDRLREVLGDMLEPDPESDPEPEPDPLAQPAAVVEPDLDPTGDAG